MASNGMDSRRRSGSSESRTKSSRGRMHVPGGGCDQRSDTVAMLQIMWGSTASRNNTTPSAVASEVTDPSSQDVCGSRCTSEAYFSAENEASVVSERLCSSCDSTFASTTTSHHHRKCAPIESAAPAVPAAAIAPPPVTPPVQIPAAAGTASMCLEATTAPVPPAAGTAVTTAPVPSAAAGAARTAATAQVVLPAAGGTAAVQAASPAAAVTAPAAVAVGEGPVVMVKEKAASEVCGCMSDCDTADAAVYIKTRQSLKAVVGVQSSTVSLRGNTSMNTKALLKYDGYYAFTDDGEGEEFQDIIQQEAEEKKDEEKEEGASAIDRATMNEKGGGGEQYHKHYRSSDIHRGCTGDDNRRSTFFSGFLTVPSCLSLRSSVSPHRWRRASTSPQRQLLLPPPPPSPLSPPALPSASSSSSSPATSPILSRVCVVVDTTEGAYTGLSRKERNEGGGSPRSLGGSEAATPVVLAAAADTKAGAAVTAATDMHTGQPTRETAAPKKIDTRGASMEEATPPPAAAGGKNKDTAIVTGHSIEAIRRGVRTATETDTEAAPAAVAAVATVPAAGAVATVRAVAEMYTGAAGGVATAIRPPMKDERTRIAKRVPIVIETHAINLSAAEIDPAAGAGASLTAADVFEREERGEGGEEGEVEEEGDPWSNCENLRSASGFLVKETSQIGGRGSFRNGRSGNSHSRSRSRWSMRHVVRVLQQHGVTLCGPLLLQFHLILLGILLALLDNIPYAVLLFPSPNRGGGGGGGLMPLASAAVAATVFNSQLVFALFSTFPVAIGGFTVENAPFLRRISDDVAHYFATYHLNTTPPSSSTNRYTSTSGHTNSHHSSSSGSGSSSSSATNTTITSHGHRHHHHPTDTVTTNSPRSRSTSTSSRIDSNIHSDSISNNSSTKNKGILLLGPSSSSSPYSPSLSSSYSSSSSSSLFLPEPSSAVIERSGVFLGGDDDYERRTRTRGRDPISCSNPRLCQREVSADDELLFSSSGGSSSRSTSNSSEKVWGGGKRELRSGDMILTGGNDNASAHVASSSSLWGGGKRELRSGDMILTGGNDNASAHVASSSSSLFPSSFSSPSSSSLSFSSSSSSSSAFLKEKETEIMSTTLVCWGLASILTAAVFYIAGAFKCGNVLAKYLPPSLLMGCIGGMGIYIVTAAIGVAADAEWRWTYAELCHMFSTSSLPRIGITVAAEALLILSELHVSSSAFTPAFLLLFPVAFYVVFFFTGTALEDARRDKWFFTSNSGNHTPTTSTTTTFTAPQQWKYHPTNTLSYADHLSSLRGLFAPGLVTDNILFATPPPTPTTIPTTTNTTPTPTPATTPTPTPTTASTIEDDASSSFWNQQHGRSDTSIHTQKPSCSLLSSHRPTTPTTPAATKIPGPAFMMVAAATATAAAALTSSSGSPLQHKTASFRTNATSKRQFPFRHPTAFSTSSSTSSSPHLRSLSSLLLFNNPLSSQNIAAAAATAAPAINDTHFPTLSPPPTPVATAVAHAHTDLPTVPPPPAGAPAVTARTNTDLPTLLLPAGAAAIAVPTNTDLLRLPPPAAAGAAAVAVNTDTDLPTLPPSAAASDAQKNSTDILTSHAISAANSETVDHLTPPDIAVAPSDVDLPSSRAPAAAAAVAHDNAHIPTSFAAAAAATVAKSPSVRGSPQFFASPAAATPTIATTAAATAAASPAPAATAAASSLLESQEKQQKQEEDHNKVAPEQHNNKQDAHQHHYNDNAQQQQHQQHYNDNAQQQQQQEYYEKQSAQQKQQPHKKESTQQQQHWEEEEEEPKTEDTQHPQQHYHENARQQQQQAKQHNLDEHRQQLQQHHHVKHRQQHLQQQHHVKHRQQHLQQQHHVKHRQQRLQQQQDQQQPHDDDAAQQQQQYKDDDAQQQPQQKQQQHHEKHKQQQQQPPPQQRQQHYVRHVQQQPQQPRQQQQLQRQHQCEKYRQQQQPYYKEGGDSQSQQHDDENTEQQRQHHVEHVKTKHQQQQQRQRHSAVDAEKQQQHRDKNAQQQPQQHEPAETSERQQQQKNGCAGVLLQIEKEKEKQASKKNETAVEMSASSPSPHVVGKWFEKGLQVYLYDAATSFFPVLANISFSAISWHCVASQWVSIAAIVFFSVLHAPINVPALSLSTNTAANLDYELQVHGLANAATALTGGLQCYMTYSTSTLLWRCGMKSSSSRTSTAAIALGLALLLLFTPSTNMLLFLPRPAGALLMMHVGVVLVHDGLISSYTLLSLPEYIAVLLTAVCMQAAFVEGVLLGVLLALLFHAARALRLRLFCSSSAAPTTTGFLCSETP